MRIALVEDDREDLLVLEDMVREILGRTGIYDREVHCFSGSQEFLDAWEPGRFDVILLDIFLDAMNGVDLARRIRESDQEAVLAFCTSCNDFAAQSYEVNARYYLLKPYAKEKVEAMFQRINLERIEANRSLQLPDGYRFLLRKLMYTNYVNHVVTFYIQDEEPHSIYTTQTEVARLLNYSCFFPVNKGSIVNLSMIKRVAGESLVMRDGHVLSLSRRRGKEVREAYTRFHFQKLCEEVV